MNNNQRNLVPTINNAIEYKDGKISYYTYGEPNKFMAVATIPTKYLEDFNCNIKLELISTCTTREEAEKKIINDAKKYVDYLLQVDEGR